MTKGEDKKIREALKREAFKKVPPAKPKPVPAKLAKLLKPRKGK